VYNKLEPQLFLLFDCHKYGELGSKFYGIESWELSAVPSIHPTECYHITEKLLKVATP
jgi:hypothetical protein